MPRAALEVPAVMKVGEREVHCTLRDLSSHGISVTVKESVAPGMVVRVLFRLPNSPQPVEVSGTLTRSSGGRGESIVGLQFVDPDADAVRVIDSYVARNRSDQPFSERQSQAGRASEIDRQQDGGSLTGLYEEAVSEFGGKAKKKRGFFSRWRGER